MSFYAFSMLLCLLTGFFSQKSFAAKKPEKVIVAYVTSWTRDIPDPDYVTHINYAFGHVTDSFDGVRIDNPDRLKAIAALKESHPKLKVMLSIGGGGSGRFSEMAADAGKRESFAEDCARVVKDFNLDGIDIDWEYPGSAAAGISSSPDDTRNFTLLMEDIRKSIGKKRLLTLASVASGRYIAFGDIAKTVDFVNIMMYDSGNPPKHHASLHRSPMSGGVTADEAVKAHRAAGMPAHKLVLGIPFYGRGNNKEIKGFIHYKDLLKLEGLDRKWDEQAKANYMVNAQGDFVLTYETPESIALKCAFIADQGLLGAMYWEYAGDDQEGTLRKAVYQGVMQPEAAHKPFKVLAFYAGNWDVAHISFVKEANAWFSSVADAQHFTYTATDDWNQLKDSVLNQYDVVLFLDKAPVETEQRAAFERYIKKGGGFIGFHVAAYNDKDVHWDWYYNELLGCGKFAGNTWKPTSANLRIEQATHPIAKGLPELFSSQPNEWYKWEKDLRKNPKIQILLSIDSSSFPLGTGPKPFEIWHEGYYPVVWTNTDYNMLYINMGHNDMLYNPDRTVSHTFDNAVQNKLIINSLKWLVENKNRIKTDNDR